MTVAVFIPRVTNIVGHDSLRSVPSGASFEKVLKRRARTHVTAVVLSPGYVAPTLTELRLHVTGSLGPTVTPHEMHVVDTLPRHGIGKVDRGEPIQRFTP